VGGVRLGDPLQHPRRDGHLPDRADRGDATVAIDKLQPDRAVRVDPLGNDHRHHDAIAADALDQPLGRRRPERLVDLLHRHLAIDDLHAVRPSLAGGPAIVHTARCPASYSPAAAAFATGAPCVYYPPPQ